MLHEPAGQPAKDYGLAYKTRLGVWMFLLYALVYAGFMGLNIAAPKLMAKVTPILGMNLASVYGFGLIVFALVLAIIYNRLCSRKESTLRKADEANRGEGDA